MRLISYDVRSICNGSRAGPIADPPGIAHHAGDLDARGPSTVAEVLEPMEPRLAYTTVQTVLNILARKGKVKRALRGRAFVYRAAVSEERVLGHAVRDLVERMFSGSIRHCAADA